MGLNCQTVRCLTWLKERGALEGARAVAEIGDQQLADNLITDMEGITRLYAAFGRPVSKTALGPPVGPENFARLAPSSRYFWASLGLDRTAFDITPGAVRLDLNRQRVSWRHRRRFDLVINAGTTEHIANQLSAFKAIHDLTRVGGVMYHELPVGALSDHGFFAYQPKWFCRLAEHNDYEWLLQEISGGEGPPTPDWIKAMIHGGKPAPYDGAIRIAFRRRSRLWFRPPLDA